MSGTKKAAFRKAGGFLNNVDGVIADYQFTTTPPFANDGGYIYATISARVDGQAEPVETSLFAGGTAEDFTISDDGHSLTPTDTGRNLSATTAFADFISSLEAAMAAADHDGGTQVDDDDVIDFSPILNARVRFEQQPLDEAELAGLKRRGKATVRKDANGKSWPLTKVVTSAFYGVESGSGKKGGSGKGGPVKGGGKAVSAPKAAAFDVETVAAEVLLEILAKAPKHSITKSKLATPVLQAMLKRADKAEKEVVRKFLFNDEHLAAIDGIEYDEASETISLA